MERHSVPHAPNPKIIFKFWKTRKPFYMLGFRPGLYLEPKINGSNNFFLDKKTGQIIDPTYLWFSWASLFGLFYDHCWYKISLTQECTYQISSKVTLSTSKYLNNHNLFLSKLQNMVLLSEILTKKSKVNYDGFNLNVKSLGLHLPPMCFLLNLNLP